MLRSLSAKEKYTFLLHFLFCTLDSFSSGIFLLRENILKKTFFASDGKVVALFTATVGIFILSSYINELIRRTRKKKRFVRLVAVVTRLPMLMFLFFPSSPDRYEAEPIYSYLYIVAFGLFYMGTTAILPVINLLIKSNYSPKYFHKLYSWASTWGMVIVILSTFGAGEWLNQSEYNYRYIYAGVGITGLLAVWILTRIPFTSTPPKVRYSLFRSVAISYVRAYRILKRNKPFFHFELSFMLYGLAFMGGYALIKVYYEEVLHLSYASLALNENVANFWKIVAMPIVAILLGRIDPRRFQMFPFLFFALMYAFLILAQYIDVSYDLGNNYIIYWMLFFAMTSYGIFYAMNTLTWNIGSTYFCKPHEVSDYQSVHLVLTGLRGVFAPWVGYLFFVRFESYTAVFAIAIVLLLCAVGLLGYSAKKYPIVNG